MAQITHAPLLARLEATPRLPVLSVVALRAAVILAQWSFMYRTRKNLHDLDPHLLRDVGIEPGDAQREAAKRFWQ